MIYVPVMGAMRKPIRELCVQQFLCRVALKNTLKKKLQSSDWPKKEYTSLETVKIMQMQLQQFNRKCDNKNMNIQKAFEGSMKINQQLLSVIQRLRLTCEVTQMQNTNFNVTQHNIVGMS